jgi:HlyD family secretion protein/epimerase transport system membrane fusion protein
VQHLRGGVVEEIMVDEGQAVENGQPLIRLNNTEAKANFDAARAKLDAALARRARLIAERDRASGVSFPPELSERAAGSQDVREILAGERDLFAQRRDTLEGRVAIEEEKIGQLRQEIAGLRAQRSSKQEQVSILETELVDLRALHEQGYYPRTRVLSRERELAGLRGSIGADAAAIARAEKSISEARLQIEQARQEYTERAVSRLRETEEQISDLRQQLVVADQRLRRTTITAPATGTVQELKVHTDGGVIQAGQTVMQVVPVGDRLIVEAQVNPQDIDSVVEGQEAEVRMTALQQRTTPVLIGKVTGLSPDRIVPESNQAEPYYRARVEIPPDEVAKLGEGELRAGMPAQIMINTGERTVLDYLLQPITDAMARSFTEQ